MFFLLRIFLVKPRRSDAGNYQLASTSATTTADITVRSLTVSATGNNKAYDGSTSATVTMRMAVKLTNAPRMLGMIKPGGMS